MNSFENHNEALSMKEQIASIINKSKIEQKNLKTKIDKNDDKIGGYKITNKFDGFLKPSEKGFAIVLSESTEGTDNLDVSIIVKYENGEITIRDTQQEPFGEQEYNEITLSNDEQINGNDNVNKINKIIRSRGFNTIKGDDLNKLAKKIETLKK